MARPRKLEKAEMQEKASLSNVFALYFSASKWARLTWYLHICPVAVRYLADKIWSYIVEIIFDREMWKRAQ